MILIKFPAPNTILAMLGLGQASAWSTGIIWSWSHGTCLGHLVPVPWDLAPVVYKLCLVWNTAFRLGLLPQSQCSYYSASSKVTTFRVTKKSLNWTWTLTTLKERCAMFLWALTYQESSPTLPTPFGFSHCARQGIRLGGLEWGSPLSGTMESPLLKALMLSWSHVNEERKKWT